MTIASGGIGAVSVDVSSVLLLALPFLLLIGVVYLCVRLVGRFMKSR